MKFFVQGNKMSEGIHVFKEDDPLDPRFVRAICGKLFQKSTLVEHQKDDAGCWCLECKKNEDALCKSGKFCSRCHAETYKGDVCCRNCGSVFIPSVGIP